MRSAAGWLWLTVLGAALPWGVAGCAAQEAVDTPDAERTVDTKQDPAVPWPARAVEIVREVEAGPWRFARFGEGGFGVREADRESAALVASRGGVATDRVTLEGPGSMVVRMPSGEWSRTARVAGQPIAAMEYLSGSETDDGSLQLERTWFVLYGPDAEPEAESGQRGLVLLLPGMFGTPEPVIDPLVGHLRGRGWHVLRMLTHPSRFTERRSYLLDPGSPDELAGEIANEFGDRAASCALAVEAVCAHIAENMPGVPVGSRVGLGMSGGGMVLPTVIARERDAYRAGVFIGAGCDFAAIALESNYTDWIDAVRLEWLTEPGDEAQVAFTDAYRQAAGFDSYATAPLLEGLSMLMLHGEQDRAVPAQLGDLLWERLGEPVRWSVPATHEILFLAYLPTRFEDLVDWIGVHAAD